MDYRRLGDTGLLVSVVGFGASPLGGEYGSIDPAAGRRVVAFAVDQGINYFDVAPYYGETLAEERLGSYLEGKRQQVILATKVGRYGRDLPEGFDFSAQRVERSVEESLRRLRTDVIDVLQVHDVEFGDREQIIHETLPALHRLKEQGKIRFGGITGYPLHVLKDIASRGSVDTVLSYCHYNLLNTKMDQVLVPLVNEGVGLINASPLYMRGLTRQGAPSWHPAPGAVLQAARKAAEWCKQQGVDVAELAMQFALAHPAVGTTLVGMSDVQQVEMNVRCVEVRPDEDVLRKVLSMFEPVRDVEWVVGLPENNDPETIAVDGTHRSRSYKTETSAGP